MLLEYIYAPEKLILNLNITYRKIRSLIGEFVKISKSIIGLKK